MNVDIFDLFWVPQANLFGNPDKKRASISAVLLCSIPFIAYAIYLSAVSNQIVLV